MGRWNRRNYYGRPYTRRYKYQDYQWSPPRDEPCPDPETEVWEDNVPMWEKKFCYLVGRMPWKKVLSSNKFMNSHTHSNVLNWDDSAGKEAFLTAKKRFWEELNGLPCETQLPNPDMYIDEVDWNPYIDPDLARECDKEYFNPDDKYFLPSAAGSKGNHGWAEDVDDPWQSGYVQGSSEKNKIPDASKSNKDEDPWERERHHKPETEVFKDTATGWNKWDNSGNNSGKLNANNDLWENHHTQGNDVKDNSWEGEWNKSWVSKPNDHLNANKDPWESHHVQGNGVAKDNSWEGEWNKSWVSKPNDHNANKDPWESHHLQGNGVAKDNVWGRGWDKSWVSKANGFSCTTNTSSANADGSSWRKEGSGWQDGNSWRKEGSGWQDRGASSRNWRQEGKEVAYTSYWSEKHNRTRPQEHGSYRGGRMPNGRGNHWGQKPRDKYNWGPKDSINIHRGQGQFNAGCRKRESTDYYEANYKGPRLQGDGQSLYHRDGGNMRRVSFGGQQP